MKEIKNIRPFFYHGVYFTRVFKLFGRYFVTDTNKTKRAEISKTVCRALRINGMSIKTQMRGGDGNNKPKEWM